MAQLQIQPRVYQVLEVCQRATGDKPRLIRLCYTSRKVPYKVLVHYLGDPRPYVDLSVNVLTAADDDDTPAGMFKCVFIVYFRQICVKLKGGQEYYFLHRGQRAMGGMVEWEFENSVSFLGYLPFFSER